jgi:hypothetical protein
MEKIWINNQDLVNEKRKLLFRQKEWRTITSAKAYKLWRLYSLIKGIFIRHEK